MINALAVLSVYLWPKTQRSFARLHITGFGSREYGMWIDAIPVSAKALGRKGDNLVLAIEIA